MNKVHLQEREKEMKTAIAIVMALALTAFVGCQSSGSRGGGMAENEGFRIAVPTFGTDVKQGEMQTVTVSLDRGESFKQDVKLRIKTTEGISVDPTSVWVKAGDKPDVQLRIAASKDAALGEYRVHVTGTPETGEPTSADFNMKVVAP
ncbi:MAG: hypothetical protein ABR964_04170 [Tepidisphaeraceae bacterium]